MKIIFLRGLPGSGKTILADKLASDLGGEVLHVDDFKTQLRKDFPGQFSWPEIRAKSYDQTLEFLSRAKEDGKSLVVCEELMCDKGFVESLQKFCVEEKIETTWFRIERDIEKLLELEQSPERINRPVHNTREDFEKLDSDIAEIIIPEEIIINNDKELTEAFEEIKRGLIRETPAEELSNELKKF